MAGVCLWINDSPTFEREKFRSMVVQVRRFSRHRESSPATSSRAFFFFPPWPRRENSEKVRGHDNKQPAVPSSIRFSEFLLSWNVLSRLISFHFLRILFRVERNREEPKRGINNTSFYIILRRIFKNRQTMERLDRNVEELICGVNREIHG